MLDCGMAIIRFDDTSVTLLILGTVPQYTFGIETRQKEDANANARISVLGVEWLTENINEFRLVAAFLAAAFAFLAILSHRRTTARKATLDFILNRELHDPNWLQLRLRVYPLLKDPGKWGPLIQAPSNKEKQDVLAWLNHHEIIAVGINHRALDQNLYFDWFEDMYRADWALANDFVNTFRNKQKNAENAFVDFERLATSKPRRTALFRMFVKAIDVLLYVLATLAAILATLLLLA